MPDCWSRVARRGKQSLPLSRSTAIGGWWWHTIRFGCARRAASDHGARVQLAQALSQVGVSRLIQLDLESSLFNWWWEVPAFKRALALDGKLIVVTNVPEWDAAEVIARYQARADIERGFRVLKS